jgi:gliding motility-associated-like protein
MDDSCKKMALCGSGNTYSCPTAVNAIPQLEIPDVFTPNGDHSNDLFIIRALNITGFSCKIFDRWGNLIFEWADIHKGWDGKTKTNTIAPDGTYRYLIHYSDYNKKSFTRKGYFQMVK